MNIGKLKGLMGEFDHKQIDICNLLNITPQGLRLKLKGQHEFKASEIKALADFYGVPTDYFFYDSVAKMATKEAWNSEEL